MKRLTRCQEKNFLNIVHGKSKIERWQLLVKFARLSGSWSNVMKESVGIEERIAKIVEVLKAIEETLVNLDARIQKLEKRVLNLK